MMPKKKPKMGTVLTATQLGGGAPEGIKGPERTGYGQKEDRGSKDARVLGLTETGEIVDPREAGLKRTKPEPEPEAEEVSPLEAGLEQAQKAQEQKSQIEAQAAAAADAPEEQAPAVAPHHLQQWNPLCSQRNPNPNPKRPGRTQRPLWSNQ